MCGSSRIDRAKRWYPHGRGQYQKKPQGTPKTVERERGRGREREEGRREKTEKRKKRDEADLGKSKGKREELVVEVGEGRRGGRREKMEL